MIDFRYHIVSLISVFLALAIGIVLGAGPLKDAIGDQLTGQVEDLRAGKEDLRVALTETEKHLEQRDEFLEGISDSVLSATLPGRRVALVELEEVPDELIDQVSARLEAAGGTVTDRVKLDESWTSDSKASFRQSLVSTLLSYLDDYTSEGTTDKDLAAALTQSLIMIDPQDETKPSPAAADIRSLLAASDLVTYAQETAAPADMIVFLSNPNVESQPDASATELESRSQTLQVQGILAGVASEISEATVVVSVGEGENDLLNFIIANDEFAERVSTVAGLSQLPGQMNVPLALASRAVGTVGHFGDQPGATAQVPEVMYLEVADRSTRTAALPEPEDESDADAQFDSDSPDEADDAQDTADDDEAAAEEQA